MAAFRGRQRRVRNAATDMLGLKDGDPIMYAGKMTRFDSKRMTKADRSYGFIQRLTPQQTKMLEELDAERVRRAEEITEYHERRRAFYPV
jgi:tRNA A37 N6-isopentenylltransferase MiaA